MGHLDMYVRMASTRYVDQPRAVVVVVVVDVVVVVVDVVVDVVVVVVCVTVLLTCRHLASMC